MPAKALARCENHKNSHEQCEKEATSQRRICRRWRRCLLSAGIKKVKIKKIGLFCTASMEKSGTKTLSMEKWDVTFVCILEGRNIEHFLVHQSLCRRLLQDWQSSDKFLDLGTTCPDFLLSDSKIQHCLETPGLLSILQEKPVIVVK